MKLRFAYVGLNMKLKFVYVCLKMKISLDGVHMKLVSINSLQSSKSWSSHFVEIRSKSSTPEVCSKPWTHEVHSCFSIHLNLLFYHWSWISLQIVNSWSAFCKFRSKRWSHEVGNSLQMVNSWSWKFAPKGELMKLEIRFESATHEVGVLKSFTSFLYCQPRLWMLESKIHSNLLIHEVFFISFKHEVRSKSLTHEVRFKLWSHEVKKKTREDLDEAD